MSLFDDYVRYETRRQFFARGKNVLGAAALSSLLGERLAGTLMAAGSPASKPIFPHFPARAKQVIYLHMVGGPSQMDLFDYKPQMQQWYDKDLPESIRNGQRLTTMTSGQSRFPIAPSKYKFSQTGKCGMWMNTELLPWLAKCADDMCFIRSMHTEAINHEPAITAMQTGNQVTGRPCIGSWLSYGLGALNKDLPAFVVLVAEPTNREQMQAISARLWSNGYLPGEHAGVSFRSVGDPILFINNPPGISSDLRRRQLDGLKSLNELNYQLVGDPETHTRIQQFEMAFRMQASVPELTQISNEPESTYQLYGDEAKKPGTFAYSALHVAAVDRARRALRPGLPQQLGPPREPRQPHAEPMQGHRSGDLRAHPGSEATRHVRGYAHHLGRRVRPHHLQPGRAQPKKTTDATTTRAASPCGWPAAARKAASSTARPTIFPTTSSKIPSTSATSTPPCSTSSASTTSASPTNSRGSTRNSPASSRRASCGN